MSSKTETALRVELRRDTRDEVSEVAAGRALVGSGAHCDVRLRPDEGASEQLVLEVRSTEVYCKVLAPSPPCLIDGAPFLESRLPPGTWIQVSGVSLTASTIERSVGVRAEGESKSQTHPAVQAVALLGLAVGFYFVLSKEPPPPSALDAAAEPPASFEVEAQPCPASGARAAASLAAQAHRDADTRRERSPFYLRDGLRAVPLYRRAAACYERAGEPALAREAEQAADGLTAWLNDELRLRHVRIERLIAQRKYAALRREVQQARALMSDPTSAYAQWLSALAREAELRTVAER